MSHKARGTNGLHGDVACVNLFLIYLKSKSICNFKFIWETHKNKNGSSYLLLSQMMVSDRQQYLWSMTKSIQMITFSFLGYSQ